ncbi:MAG: L-threonylcarbamoyladenylate synthase [Phycisphaerae bacterium]|nr:L-threonylcarbamoyladenylate synthase [Phycisphaerae bacterium]
MSTEIVTLDRTKRLNHEAIRQAAEIMMGGGLVAFPTETVYGVGTCTRSKHGLERLRALKKRPPDKPFGLMVPSASAAHWFVPFMTALPRRLMRKAWPGPLTIVVEVEHPLYCPAADVFGSEAVEPLFNFDNTIGLRCPDDPIALALLERVDGPVVSASANHAGEAPATTAAEVIAAIGKDVELVLDGGPVPYGVASTVVKIIGAGRGFQILRVGLLDERTIDKMAIETWLFVCTGNTCRSPMAAAVARARLAKAIGCPEEDLTLAGYRVLSAGVLAADGVPATPAAADAVAALGGNLAAHKAARLTVDAIRQADRIFVMTEAHRDAVLSLMPAAQGKIRLLSVDEPIEDPIGGADEVYRRVADQIAAAIDLLVKEEIE